MVGEEEEQEEVRSPLVEGRAVSLCSRLGGRHCWVYWQQSENELASARCRRSAVPAGVGTAQSTSRGSLWRRCGATAGALEEL